MKDDPIVGEDSGGPLLCEWYSAQIPEFFEFGGERLRFSDSDSDKHRYVEIVADQQRNPILVGRILVTIHSASRSPSLGDSLLSCKISKSKDNMGIDGFPFPLVKAKRSPLGPS